MNFCNYLVNSDDLTVRSLDLLGGSQVKDEAALSNQFSLSEDAQTVDLGLSISFGGLGTADNNEFLVLNAIG